MPHMLHAWMLDPAGRRNLWCFSIFLCHLKQREENRRVSALSCFDDFEGSFLRKTDERNEIFVRKKTKGEEDPPKTKLSTSSHIS